MSKLLFSSVVIFAVISVTAAFHWNSANKKFEGDLLPEFTRFLNSLDKSAYNRSIDLECLNELMDLSTGLQSNELWALKCNYQSSVFIIIH